MQLGLDVLIGLAARVVLAATTAYREVDADIFADWARTMHQHSLGEFYVWAPRPDHLPGDLWILKGIQSAYTSAGGNDFGSPTFELLTNAVPMIADVLVGVLLFLIVRLWSSEEVAARAARWYLLNPAVIVIAGAWGQWDSVAIAVLLTGFLLVLRPGRAWVGAAPVMVWAVLIKPQMVVPAAILLLWVVIRPDKQVHGAGRSRQVPHAVALGTFLVLSVLTALAVLQPFRVGFAWTPDGGSSLAARLRYAGDLHGFTTMGAANIWLVVDRSVIGPADDVARWGHLTPASVGISLLAVLWCLVAVTAWWAFPPVRRLESLFWAAAAAVLCACVVLTRVHERYYFPVLVLLLLWTAVRGFDRLAVISFWTFSAIFVVDLALPMGWTGHDDRLLHRPAALVIVGLLHVAFLAVFLAVPWFERSGSGSRLMHVRQQPLFVERRQTEA